MPFQWYRTVGTQDPEEGGEPIAVMDLEDRTIQVGTKYKIKTVGASYSVVPEDSGSLILVNAAATITLPTASGANKGVWVDIMVIADVDVVVATETADTFILSNDIAADSISWATSSQKVGNAIRCVSTGEKWVGMQMPGALTGTATVSTPTIVTN